MKQYYADKLLQATVLEEMPAFPERESSILALLKRKKPGRVLPDSVEGKDEKIPSPSPVNVNQVGLFEGDRAKRGALFFFALIGCLSRLQYVSNNTAATDLLGLSTPPTSAATSNSNALVDVLGDLYSSSNNVGASSNSYNPKK